MSGVFYGIIQKVESDGDRLIVRCVRSFFHPDGLMGDDVWTWEIERPEEDKIAVVKAMVGREVQYFEVGKTEQGQWLRISVDDDGEAISISGKHVGKKEGPRDERDLKEVVAQLSRRISCDEADHLALSRKLAAVATFVDQKIDRVQKRAAFEKQRESGKTEGFNREIEDLQGILRKLKEPSEAPEPSAPSGRGSS